MVTFRIPKLQIPEKDYGEMVFISHKGSGVMLYREEAIQLARNILRQYGIKDN